MSVRFFSSLTRIADFDQKGFECKRLAKEQWADGDYVVGKVVGKRSPLYRIELANGRVVRVFGGDLIVGAFGHRAATLEGAGSWTAMTDDTMHALTAAGLFGVFTSMSPLLPEPMTLEYQGHVLRNDTKVCMQDFAIQSPPGELTAPVVLLVGTSMSAGKTTVGRRLVHELASQGHKVVGAKLTGAGRYRDVLSFLDAGASAIFDFVDAGLPSTVIPEPEFLSTIRPLLHHIAGLKPDVLVVEAGASPYEPYNGAAAMTELEGLIKCTVLCATDPYAVVGVQRAFGLEPDLVAGPAANTTAGVKLVKKLTGKDAVNVLDSSTLPQLRSTLTKTLGPDFAFTKTRH